MESQLPFVRQFLFEFLDRGEQVARFFNAGDNFVGAEFQQIDFLLFQTVGDFVPGNRCGNGWLFPGTKRINADRCFVFVVLTPIDEHFSFPYRLRHVRRDQVTVLAFEMPRERA